MLPLSLGKGLTIFGLLLDTIGVCILFLFAWPQPDFGGEKLLLDKKSLEQGKVDKHIHSFYAIIVLVCMVIGFFIPNCRNLIQLTISTNFSTVI